MFDPEHIKETLIVEGIKSVQQHERREPRRRGGVRGFEMCRNLHTQEDFANILNERRTHETTLALAHKDAATYWEYRYATIQIEFMYDRMKILWNLTGTYFSPTVSARAMQHVLGIIAKKIREN